MGTLPPDRPQCAKQSVTNNKIAIDSTTVTIVDCHLDSHPPPSTVYWITAKQGHQQRISPSQYTLMDGFSRLSYQPERETDFGELLCYGVNDVGTQQDPCRFTIEAAGRPYPLANCSLYNSTAGVEVSCSPGFDGGLTQMFVLEISDPESGATLRNLSRVAPRFLLQGVTANHPVIVQVYAANSRGRSEVVTVAESVWLREDTTKATELPPDLVLAEPFYLIIGGAAIGFLLMITISSLWYFKRRVRPQKKTFGHSTCFTPG